MSDAPSDSETSTAITRESWQAFIQAVRALPVFDNQKQIIEDLNTIKSQSLELNHVRSQPAFKQALDALAQQRRLTDMLSYLPDAFFVDIDKNLFLARVDFMRIMIPANSNRMFFRL